MDPSFSELGGVRPKGGGLGLWYHQGWLGVGLSSEELGHRILCGLVLRL